MSAKNAVIERNMIITPQLLRTRLIILKLVRIVINLSPVENYRNEFLTF